MAKELPEKKFAGFAEPGQESVVLQDGSQLVPGTRDYHKYQVVVLRVDPSEVGGLHELHQLFSSLRQTIDLVFSVDPVPSTPLSAEWVIYFDRFDQTSQKTLTASDVKRNLLEVGSFKTLEGFWRYWHHLPVRELRGTAFYRIFKKGISPHWEDPANKNGGKVVTRTVAQERVTIWKNFAQLIINDEAISELGVCGGVLCSNKTKPPSAMDCLQLWVDGRMQVTDSHAQRMAGAALEDVKIRCHIEFGYTPHTRDPNSQVQASPLRTLTKRSDPDGRRHRGSSRNSWHGSVDSASERGSAGGGSSGHASPLNFQATRGFPSNASNVSGGSGGTVYQHNPYQSSSYNGSSHQPYPKGPTGLSGWPTYSYGYGTNSPSMLKRHGSADWSVDDAASEASFHPTLGEVAGQEVEPVLRQVTANLLGLSAKDPSSALRASAPSYHWASPQPSEMYEQPDSVSLDLGGTPSTFPAEKKKKRNKPDKHQRERLRRKKARQQMLEELMMEMAGTKCLECELHLATVKCEECPQGREVFCSECFTLIHKVGKRQQHTSAVTFENAGELPEDGKQPPQEGEASDAEDEQPTEEEPAATPVVESEVSPKSRDKNSVLAAFGGLASAFEAYVKKEVGGLEELFGFSDRDLRSVCNEFFDGKQVSALKRGRASKELTRWVQMNAAVR